MNDTPKDTLKEHLDRVERKAKFIRVLAEHLTEDMARKSIQLQAGMAEGKAWSKLFSAAGLRGWIEVDEAEAVLKDLLG
jgi:hypothetical protein